MLFLFVPVMFWSAMSPAGCWFEDGAKTCVVSAPHSSSDSLTSRLAALSASSRIHVVRGLPASLAPSLIVASSSGVTRIRGSFSSLTVDLSSARFGPRLPTVTEYPKTRHLHSWITLYTRCLGSSTNNAYPEYLTPPKQWVYKV